MGSRHPPGQQCQRHAGCLLPAHTPELTLCLGASPTRRLHMQLHTAKVDNTNSFTRLGSRTQVTMTEGCKHPASQRHAKHASCRLYLPAHNSLVALCLGASPSTDCICRCTLPKSTTQTASHAQAHQVTTTPVTPVVAEIRPADVIKAMQAVNFTVYLPAGRTHLSGGHCASPKPRLHMQLHTTQLHITKSLKHSGSHTEPASLTHQAVRAAVVSSNITSLSCNISLVLCTCGCGRLSLLVHSQTTNSSSSCPSAITGLSSC
jgi:hypothetical protein